MKPPGDCRQGEKAVCVKEETPEHSPPPPAGARSPSEPVNPKTSVQLVYLSHGVYLGDHTYATAESPTELHINEGPDVTSFVYDVKEEAPCVDEGELQCSGLHGMSAAAMLASLYTDHVVKDELVLGPELPHRPSVTPVFCEKEPTIKPEMEAEAGSSNGLVLYEQSSIKIKIKDKDEACKEEKLAMLHRTGMKPPGDCRQGEKAVCVKEETPEHSPPPPAGARSPSEPVNPKTSVQLVYLSHGVYLGDHTYATAESPTELHINEGPDVTSFVYDVKEEAPCVDEGELQCSGLHGMSAAAMLASLYTDHVVKDELVLGPELPHRPSVTPVFCEKEPTIKPEMEAEAGSSNGLVLYEQSSIKIKIKDKDEACKEEKLAMLQKEPTIKPEMEAEAGSSNGLVLYEQSSIKIKIKDKDEACKEEKLAMLLHIKEEQEFRMDEVVHVKEEPPVPCSETEGEGCSGVSEAATRAGLYADHIIKDELVLGPERPHRPTLLSSPPGHVVSSDAGLAEALGRSCSVRPERLPLDADVAEALGRRCSVRPERLLQDAGVAEALGRRCSVRPERLLQDAGVAEALGRRCSVRLERLLLDAERRACRVGRRTYRLRPESEPRRAASPATDTYRCDHCDKAFRHKSLLSKHIHTHLSTKPFHCNYCDYKCSRREQLKRHEMIHTGEKPFQCNYCDFQCRGKYDLRRHEMTHTGVKLFQCNYCDYKCSEKWLLKRHEMTHTGAKPFKCSYCDYKCRRKGQLTYHEMTHTGVKPFQCNDCDYKCRQKGDLTNHELTHTGLRSFQCIYCGYKCRRKGELTKHEMTHTGVKPFQCNYCDYKCSQKRHLRVHEMKHTGVKPFQCNYCDYKCRQKGDLTKHEMTHTGVKAVQCNYCDYKCRHKANLTKHEMTHTREKPFQRYYCDHKCTRKGDLRRHEMKHTGVNPF